jgi:NAD-dependent deacetylase
MTDLEHAREIIRTSQRLVVFTGAGVSADSGVPTFRGAAADAQWRKYDPMMLATPEGFRSNPELVYRWYTARRRQLQDVKPNAAHIAIGKLQERGADVITQNVDDLHERVAPPGAKIWKLHGTIMEDKCFACARREPLAFDNLPELRTCSDCGAWMRPGVVWFGESLDPAVWSGAEAAVQRCDAMLVVGTSGEVYPAAGLVDLARDHDARVVVVNLEPSALDGRAEVSVHGRAAEMVPQVIADVM